MKTSAYTDPRDWKRTQKDGGAYNFVSETFVQTALKSARGLTDTEAKAVTDNCAIGGTVESEYFIYERLGGAS